jgi:hypothetical protein
MPVYHFNIVDGVTLEDPVGLDCKSDTDAKIKADLIVNKLPSIYIQTVRLVALSWSMNEAPRYTRPP